MITLDWDEPIEILEKCIPRYQYTRSVLDHLRDAGLLGQRQHLRPQPVLPPSDGLAHPYHHHLSADPEKNRAAAQHAQEAPDQVEYESEYLSRLEIDKAMDGWIQNNIFVSFH